MEEYQKNWYVYCIGTFVIWKKVIFFQFFFFFIVLINFCPHTVLLESLENIRFEIQEEN